MGAARFCNSDMNQAGQYELVNTEHLLLLGTVAGSIKLFTQTLSLSEPRLAQFNEAVRHDTMGLTSHIGLSSD